MEAPKDKQDASIGGWQGATSAAPCERLQNGKSYSKTQWNPVISYQMIVYADTSALFALMVRNDYMHVRARANFEYFMRTDALLITSSYVIVETVALLQHSVGLPAVADFQARMVPIMEIIWVDAEWHNRAVSRLFSEQNRKLSLVDCLGFEIMESRDIKIAFAFDNHFEQQGLSIAAFHDLP